MKINNKLPLAVSVALTLSACSPSMTTQEYLTQAQAFAEKYDHNSAIIALKNAVRLEVKNPKVRFALGTAYLAQGDYLSAEKELEKAEKLGSSDELLLTNLMQTKLKLNKFEYVYKIAEQNSDYPEADQVIILTYAGIASIHQNKPEQAKTYIEKAVSISEESIYGQIGKAYLSHSGNKYQDGLSTVNELLTSKPDFAEALLLKGYLLQAAEKFSEAAKTFEEYAQLRPKDITSRFFIAQNFVFAQNFEAAEPQVDLLLRISEHHPLANQLKAEIEYSKQNYEVAKEYAVISFQQDESFNLSRIIAGMSAYKMGDLEQSYQYLISVKELLPPQHLVRKLIIDIQLKLGYDTEAVAELKSLADLDIADSAMLTMASNKMLASGNREAALELLQSSLALDTSNPREIAKQGVTQLRLNQADKGIEILERALKLDPELSFAEQGLAVGYLANDQFNEALAIAKKWQANEDNQVQGYLLESMVLDKQQKIPEAKVLLNKVLVLKSDTVPALYKLATYAHAEKNIEQAYSYYTQVLKLQPQHIRAMINFTRLVRSTIQDNNELFNKTVSFYQAESTVSPENNYFKLGLAYIYKLKNNFEVSLELLQDIAQSKFPLQGIEIVLGDTYKAKGDWQSAISQFQKFVDANPKHLATSHKLFGLLERTQQLDKALIQVNKSLTQFPSNAGLLLLKSFYQSKLKVAPSQNDLAKIEANEAASNHWLLDQTLGNFAYNRKDFDASAKYYASAYTKKNNDENVMNWSKSVFLKGDENQALAILEKHIKDLGESKVASAVKIMLAGAYMNFNDLPKAKTLYESTLKAQPQNIIALNNLSYIELQQNNAKQSLNYAEQAVALVKNNAYIIDTYAQALVANKQLTLALAQYDNAISLDKNNTELRINKAEALVLNHQYDVAKSLLLSLKTGSESEQSRIKQLLNQLN